MSENLAKLAHKIDFSEENEDKKTDDTRNGLPVKEREENDTKEAAAFQNQQKPWESVKTKLRDALTEVSVLYDVINIARMNREPPYQYMMLEKVSGETSSPNNEFAVKLLEKKKSLEVAAKILQTGANRMKHSSSSEKKALVEQRNFHNELLCLRQNWRLKRVGNNILGDLSFRTSGSRFWHTGTFEVTKTSEEEFEETEKRGVPPCSLKVTVPSDLEGTSFIRVLIQEGETEIASAYLMQSSRAQISLDSHWQQRLEAAQNVLFCKELFAQIAREAVQLKAPIPHIVVGNQIISSIIPGVQLVIRLCHDSSMSSSNVSAPPEKNAHQNIDLEQSLHQLLRELHHSNLNGPTPRPVTASFSFNNKKRRLAGPLALDRREIAEIQQTECVLEKILKQSRHIVLRDRTAKVLDDMAASTQDPLIMVHWSVLQQQLQATVRVFISSPGYEHFARTSMQLNIGYEDIKAILKDGRTVHLSYQEKDLRNLLTCQISEDRVSAVYDLAKSLRMQIIHYNFFVGVGPPPKLGNASAIVFATPNGRKMISLRSDPVEGPRVMIQDELNTREKSDVVTDLKWEVFPSGFQEVDMTKIPGRNFVHKMELLIGNLAHE
ncbi:putative mediator of RNA polymerase II transcription subunit 17 isoform X2 [Apostichopus japonicus]|uniref:Mediator of RNA polymerase II transcription subunit 17 n=1 Tax=Stichopus japonicus TaxID=307972 RepID=A0A2G8KLN0_STIJA|nr:putative mediator of RNA polymerase II transcription subunit 17 isoform X2 [Apostichopus japonicus]